MPESLPRPETQSRPKGLHALRSLTRGRARNHPLNHLPLRPTTDSPFAVASWPRGRRFLRRGYSRKGTTPCRLRRASMALISWRICATALANLTAPRAAAISPGRANLPQAPAYRPAGSRRESTPRRPRRVADGRLVDEQRGRGHARPCPCPEGAVAHPAEFRRLPQRQQFGDDGFNRWGVTRHGPPPPRVGFRASRESIARGRMFGSLCGRIAKRPTAGLGPEWRGLFPAPGEVRRHHRCHPAQLRLAVASRFPFLERTQCSLAGDSQGVRGCGRLSVSVRQVGRNRLAGNRSGSARSNSFSSQGRTSDHAHSSGFPPPPQTLGKGIFFLRRSNVFLLRLTIAAACWSVTRQSRSAVSIRAARRTIPIQDKIRNPIFGHAVDQLHKIQLDGRSFGIAVQDEFL